MFRKIQIVVNFSLKDTLGIEGNQFRSNIYICSQYRNQSCIVIQCNKIELVSIILTPSESHQTNITTSLKSYL